jgi:protein ImuB
VVLTLERLGIGTLGELAAVGRGALADRFGAAGIEAHRLASGEDDPPRPRTPPELLRETLELPESASGPQLERALELLIGRLLARRERRGRTLRAAVLAARLADGGSWMTEVVFREPLAEPRRMALALAPRLALLPAPAASLSLEGRSLGPPAADQLPLIERTADVRLARLREAIAQARAAAGADAALRVLQIDPGSRVQERRAVLAPFEA